MITEIHDVISQNPAARFKRNVFCNPLLNAIPIFSRCFVPYLGRTGVKVSPLCLGTMNFSYRTNEADSIAMTAAAIDRGINFIDTANYYGQPTNEGEGQGLTEAIVAKTLKGKHEGIILATKGVLFSGCLMIAKQPGLPAHRLSP